MKFWVRLPLYLWAFPTTLVGLSLFAACSVFGGVRARIVAGVLEIHGGLITVLLRDFTLLTGGAAAMTLGHVVLGQDARLLILTRSHERVHVRQCERWGPFFLPAYLGASLLLWVAGRDAYRENPFEVEAYQKESRRKPPQGRK